MPHSNASNADNALDNPCTCSGRSIVRQPGAALIVFVCLSLFGCTALAYRHMNDPARDAWQKPREVVAHLAIAPGARVADLGAGGGYFTWHLAAAVGPSGTVYAVDIDDTGLDIIAKELSARWITNVRLVHAVPNDSRLPEPVDLIFSCDTYHHQTDRVAYFASLASHLTPNGRVAILGFHPHGFFSGFLGHGTAKADVRREMDAAGYTLVGDIDLIENQHFQIFARRANERRPE